MTDIRTRLRRKFKDLSDEEVILDRRDALAEIERLTRLAIDLGAVARASVGESNARIIAGQ